MSLLRHAGRFGAVAVVLLCTLATAAAPTSSSVPPETTSARDLRCAEGQDSRSEDTGSSSEARASKPGVNEESNWGPFCEARLCMSDAECACGWRGGYCDENSMCQYN